jgi:copper transport protein
MICRGRGVAILVAVTLAALTVPSAASAHAYLVRTLPSASGILDSSPPAAELTFDEAVEPRFAIISVTDASGHQETTSPVHRSPSNPNTLVVPLRPHLPQGWYLIYWRAISVDGHPVQGAFTFAVGPNAGPAPQFVIPKLSQTATTPDLLISRWAVFLTVMAAIGLFVFRMGVARPVARRFETAALWPTSVAFIVASLLGLIAIPVYLDISTATFALRSVTDVGSLVPLFRVTAFGRGFADMETCFALFCVAGWIAIWVDRPERERRSIAEIAATTGALLAAAAVLVMPGASGHAGQTSPAGLSLLVDWLHLVSGSLWIGGLIGLLVLAAALPAARRVAGLAVAVPRFSNVAFVSVLVLLASGTVATIIHLPIVAALWETSYGEAILVKIGLLAAAMLIAAINLLSTKPRLVAARTEGAGGEPAARLLRRVVSGEVVLVTAAIFAAAVLSSIAPPSSALAEENSALTRVGPGRVATLVHKGSYALQVLISPNRAAVPNTFAVKITQGGKPLRGASVSLTFAMLDMQMANQEYQLTETTPGVYSRASPALVMVGHWGLSFNVTPRGGRPFTALVADRAGG